LTGFRDIFKLEKKGKRKRCKEKEKQILSPDRK